MAFLTTAGLLLTALPPIAPSAEPADLARRSGGSPGATAQVTTHPTIPFVVQLQITHHIIDLGQTVNISAFAPGFVNIKWNWTSLPPGCPKTPAHVLACTPTQNGTFNVTVTGSALNQSGSARSPLTVNNPMRIVVIQAVPNGVHAPLDVNLAVQVTGGSPPFTVSWLTGDNAIASGNCYFTTPPSNNTSGCPTQIWVVTYTYARGGVFTPQVWVNDSTWYFSGLGTLHAEVNVSVLSPLPALGPFGLAGRTGWYLVGAILFGVFAGGAFYWVQVRGRPRKLPAAEPWMIPREEDDPPKVAVPPKGSSPRPPSQRSGEP